MRHLAILGLLLFAPVACGLLDAVGPDRGPLLRTDSTRYVLRLVPAGGDYTIATRQMDIAWTMTNRTGHEVSAGGCLHPDPPVLEKRVGDGWVHAWGGSVLLCWREPVPFAEGEVYRSVLHVWVPLPGVNAAPQWGVDEVAGTYRLRWNELAPVSDIQRTSNEFLVLPG